MIDATTCVIVMISLFVVLILLTCVKVISKYINVLNILLCFAIVCIMGCILDFSHLADTSRNICLAGNGIYILIYLVLRGNKRNIKAEAQHGDSKITLETSVQALPAPVEGGEENGNP